MLFYLIFLLLLTGITGVRLWLAGRQIRHVGLYRQSVPLAFQARIPLEDHQKAADYTRAKTKLRMIHILTDALLLLVLTEGGLLEILDQWLLGALGNGWSHDLALGSSVLLIGALVDLPLSLYGTFGVEARFGFNRVTPRLFLVDLLSESLITVGLGAPVFLAAVWMMNSLGSLWWLWAWAAWMVFNIVLLTLYPTLIAPLFNRFTPLPPGDLRQRVETLLKRCGFRSSGLFVMDGSKRSNHGNAYFTGFGKNKRVVFFDTLLERLEPAEAEAVLAHELGHYHCKHIFQRIIVLFGLSLIFLGLLGWLKEASWFYLGLGVTTPSTAVALILFILVIPVFSFPLRPLMSFYSRKHEFEADAYAARHSPAEKLISALVKLYQDNASTLTPDPLHSAVYDSHPPAALRIARLESLQIA
ncbi:MAG: M48 family metallopeptidase [Betaproteobacteria bacterium]|nr:M48 family metallopeptidase [Betaproteobacteria bacterium]